MPSSILEPFELACGQNVHNTGNQQSTHSGHVRLGWKHRTSEQRLKDTSWLKKSYKNSEHLTNANLETSMNAKILQCYNSFLILSPKHQFHNGFAMFCLCFCKQIATAYLTPWWKHISKASASKSPHPTLFLSVLLPLTSIQWSLFDFAQRCWIASPTWSLKFATDQSSWQCKIQSWTLDRKSEIPHNDVQCFNYPIMDVIHQTVPNKKS